MFFSLLIVELLIGLCVVAGAIQVECPKCDGIGRIKD